MADLLATTAAFVDVPSVSRDEGALSEMIEAELRKSTELEVVRIGDNLVARTQRGGGRPRLVLAGHLDTVPPAGNEHARLDDDRCHGLGAADMKGGLAVMCALAASSKADAALDATYVFYVCEEIARAHSGLLAIEAVDAELLLGDAAVVLEPTAAVIEAGCQGVIRTRVHIAGRRAHSARPWAGENAIHRTARLLAVLAAGEGRRTVIDGCEYRESTQAVDIEGGVASNVIPDEVVVRISHRFAPDRTTEQAYAALELDLGGALEPGAGDRIELEDTAPAAPPSLDHPLLATLSGATGSTPRAKLGWTDVAFFYERGVPAANFGPGDGLLAHTPGEFVTRYELERVHNALARLIAEGAV